MYPFLSSNIFVLLFLASLGISKPENSTIDDVNICGDGACVKYFPPYQWTQTTSSSDTHANRSSIKSTFYKSPSEYDSDHPPSMSLEFNGTSIYAFFVVDEEGCGYNAIVDLDGENVLNMTGSDDHGTLHNSTRVYVNNSMADGHHTLNLTLTGDNSAICFDYANYTFEDDTPTQSAPTGLAATSTPSSGVEEKGNTKIIPIAIGATIGGSTFLTIVAIICYHRFEQRKARKAIAKYVVSTMENPFADSLQEYVKHNPGTHTLLQNGITRVTSGQDSPITKSYWASPTLESMHLRRQELRRHMDGVKGTLESLSSSEASLEGSTDIDFEVEDLRRRITELKRELEHLCQQERQLRSILNESYGDEESMFSGFSDTDTVHSHSAIGVAK